MVEEVDKMRVLFVKPWNATFIQSDLELMKRHFEVKVVDFVLSRKRPIATLVALLRMAVGTLWAQVVFTWFADVNALWAVRLSRILRRRSIVVVGGYEVNSMPEFGYGSMLNPKSANVVRFVLLHSDQILAVSEFIEAQIRKHVKLDNVRVLYNSVDTNKFLPSARKEELVVTVGSATTGLYAAKGVDCFVRSSCAIAAARFVVIGQFDDATRNLLREVAPNVEFTGPLAHDDVLMWFDRAKVYCQLSKQESFGIALAEAMSYECVPVVTEGGALREVVGNTGFYVPFGDSLATSTAIAKALHSKGGQIARERIVKMFSTIDRERELVRLIEGLEQPRR